MVQMFLTGQVLYTAVVVLITVHWQVMKNFSHDQFYVKNKHFAS